MKIGVNTVLFGGQDVRTALEHIAWAGYSGAELSAIQGMCEHLVLDSWREQAADLKAMAADLGLALTAMEVASLDADRLERAFEAGAEIGIPIVNVGPGGSAGDAASLDETIAMLAARAERAASHGVTLCVKAHVGKAIYNTPTTLEAMARIESPAFGIDMDPSHIHRAGEVPKDAMREVVSRVKHVHIRDCKGLGPPPGPPELQACGRGDIDLHGYLAVLAEAGYDGPVNLEVIGAAEYPLSRCAVIAAESSGYLNACMHALAKN